MKKQLPSRRDFVKGAALSATSFVLPRFHIARAGESANSKVSVAFIGAGGIAERAFEGCRGENYVALCDVDEARAAENFAAYPEAKRFTDFRQMLDRMGSEIDAVVVSTPDHIHFAAAMEAMQRGKHVYVQKPLAHSIWQVRTLKKAARQYKVITQMGNQGHATEGIRYIKEWYDAGVLGDVREVLAWFNGPDFSGRYFEKPAHYPPTGMPVPDTLNWKLWQGPVPEQEYNEIYAPLTWRGFWDYGCGELGDWACHTLDAPFWALDLGMPSMVEPVVRAESAEGFVPDQSIMRFEFPKRGKKPPVTLTWHDGFLKPELRPEWGLEDLPNNGMIMVGDRATLMTGGRPDSPRLIPEDRWADFKRDLPPKTIPRIKGGPFKEWLVAIKGGGPTPGSNFDYSADLTEMTLVGVLAQRLNKTIRYDAEKMRIKNHKGLEHYIKEPVRPGWEYGEKLWAT